MCEYGTLKPVKVTLGRVRRKKENNGDEPNWCTLCTYIEMPQQNSLRNYYRLTNFFKERKDRKVKQVLSRGGRGGTV
jgi:hypothetical protein